MGTPRIWTLKEAKAYLHGLDPRALGVAPITPHPLRFDRLAIDRKLDTMDPARKAEAVEANDNDDEEVSGELAALEEKIRGASRP